MLTVDIYEASKWLTRVEELKDPFLTIQLPTTKQSSEVIKVWSGRNDAGAILMRRASGTLTGKPSKSTVKLDVSNGILIIRFEMKGRGSIRSKSYEVNAPFKEGTHHDPEATCYVGIGMGSESIQPDSIPGLSQVIAFDIDRLNSDNAAL